MIDREMLIGAFARNLGMVKQQLEGLTHADSLVQPPFHSNCLNWTLGHLAETRNDILKELGQPPVLTEEQAARYGYGSQPVTCQEPGVVPMEELVAALERAQEGIAEGLREVPDSALARQLKFAGRDMTVGGKVFFLFWHETLHAGQVDILREMILARKK